MLIAGQTILCRGEVKALEGGTGSRAWSILLHRLGELETSPAGLGDSRMSLASVLVPMCLWAWMTLPVIHQVWDCWPLGWDGLEKRTRWLGRDSLLYLS